MKFGTLRIRFPDGTDKDYPLDLPAAVVGRAEGVSLVIDDFSVSRRHASIAIDTGNLIVEDLGSAAGTFLNGERLTPHVRYVVDPGDELRIGDLEAVYYPPPPAEAATSDATGEGLPGGLHVALVSPAVPIDPGKNVTATIAVTNRSRIVDEIELTIPALPATWYTILTPRFSLVPNAREEVQIVLHPPREHSSLAGEYDFAVHVRSREQQQEFIASGSLTLLAFESASVSLATIRTKRDFKVVAENSSNHAITLDLAGRDDDQAFQYLFGQPSIALQPGEKAIVPLRVSRKLQWFGPPSQPFFEVLGKSRETGSEVTARGQLAINPPLEKFKMPVLFTLGAIILAFTAIAVLILTDNDGAQRAGAESEYAGVHLCDDPGSEPKSDSGGGTASDGPIRPDATIAGAGNNSGGTPIFGNADSQGGPFFAQNDPRWADVEYARSTELPGGKDWCGTTIAQCGCAMTSVGVMLALYRITELPDGSQLNPQALNNWFNGEARRTERGWVSRGYIYGDVIWAAANAISGEMAKRNPGSQTIRFVRKGSGAEDEIRAELTRGRPVILEVPGHWIAAVGIDAATGDILINDPFYRDRTTLNVYAGKVRSSVIFEPSNDLSAVVLTAPADVKFRVIDKQGRVVGAGDVPDADAVVQIPGASFDSRRAWRDPTCIEQAPPPGAGTNQIMLPGNADDYTIEILDTGGQPGSVAVHTYGRDGTASISTIDTAGAAVAELSVDPDTGTTQVQVTTGGTPTPATTPTPGGEGGGADETPTPTVTPTTGPPPTPTPTPFEAATTNITLGAEPGQTRVETASNAGFELGDPIRFAPGQPNEEDNIIVGFGSMLLATPLRFAHGPGEVIERLPRPPGQGPGLPPGITPPPSTGPLEPPSTVGLACSTLYQPSPKLATFVCDLQVTGEYTITRWTLNGQVVPEFTGSNSFVMAFPEDTPANIAASVCNVTICRSVSRQEKIEFETGLAGVTGGTGGTGGTTTVPTPIPTPVPQGQVVVDCTSQFPTTPEGQVAQFDCTAKFSGNYTSISWSAPGGSPANQSGQSDTFSTRITDAPGSPTSLNITATVCNFGVCVTSLPKAVGVTRTITTLQSLPLTQVNSGHSITLMAEIKQLDGNIVPQGGIVQFRRDGEPFGAPAVVFTTGASAHAQTTGPAGNLPIGEDEQEFVFDALYLGSINAFGSQSQPRVIKLLPRLKDGCDSLDEDLLDALGELDSSCRNTTAAGGYGTPKDVGAGTIVNNVVITGGTADLAPNSHTLTPGQMFTVSGNATVGDYCPGCVRQLYLGIGGYDAPVSPDDITLPVPTGGIDHPNKTLLGPYCAIYAAVLHPTNGLAFSTQMQAPTKPGVYYIRATTTLNYFCLNGIAVGTPDKTIGRIIVQGPVSANLEIWSVPEAGVWSPLVEDPGNPNAPRRLDEMPADGRALLRVTTDPPLTSGAVTINHGGRLERQTVLGGWTTNISANICTSSTATCVAGEARIVVRPEEDTPGTPPFTITATIAPQVVRLPHPTIVTIPPESLAYATYTGATSPAQPLTVVAPSRTIVSVNPSGNVQICAESCTPIVITATVNATAGTGSPANGRISFDRRLGTGDWTAIDTCADIPVPSSGEVTCSVAPGSSGSDVGTSHQFRARFERGTSTFGPSESGPSAAVTFVKAASTAVVTGLPSSPTIGDTVSFTATVTGTNGLVPSSGTVTFRANTSIIGAAQAIDPASCTGVSCTATLQFETGSAPIAASGTYQITATYNGSDELESSPISANAPVTFNTANPVIRVCFPSAGSATQTAGTSAIVRVILTPTGSTGANRLNDNSAYVEFRHNGNPITGSDSTSRVSVSNANLAGDCGGVSGRGAEFNVSDLNASTYNLTAHYSGNSYFSSTTSSPAETLTITQITPVVTLNAITAVTVGGNLALTATVPAGSGVTSPAGGSISFYLGTVHADNLLGTDTTMTSGGGVLTASLSVPTGDGVALSTAGTAYTIVAQYNGNATNGNFAVSTATPNATNSKSVTLTKRGSSVTVPAGSGERSTQITLTATVTATGGPTTPVAPTCSSCLQFEVQVNGSGAPGSNWTVIPGALVNVAANGAASATFLVPTPGPNALFTAAGAYNVRAIYNGNTNLNGATSAAAVFTLTLATPTVTVSPISAVTIGNTMSITATVSGSGTTDPAGGTVTFRLGATVLGTVPVTSGSATLNNIPTGPGTSFPTGTTYTNITARFNGDATNGNVGVATSAAASVVVNKANLSTFNVTFPDGTAFTLGASGVIRAAISGFNTGALDNGTAQLIFRNGTANIGTGATQTIGNIGSGEVGATYNVQNLPAGFYQVSVRYTGNDVYNESIQPDPATLLAIRPAVTVSPIASVTLGNSMSITATVNTGPSGPSPENGTITFLLGTTVLGTATANASGVATLSGIPTGASTNFPTATTYNNITARFESTTTIPQGTSPAASVTVTAP